MLIDIYCWCHNLCYFNAVYLYCLLIRYCFYHSLVNKDFHYGTVQLMVRGDRHGVGSGSRRVRLASRQRRRGRRRLRPLRRRRIRLTGPRRTPRRLLRVPGQTGPRLNGVRLSRDNIQLHPRTRLAAGPRLVSYSSSQPAAATHYVPKATAAAATGAAQYVTVDDYASFHVDAPSQNSPIIVQLQNPRASSSSLGLVEDIHVIGLADRKATSASVDNQQVGSDFAGGGQYAPTTGDVVAVVQQPAQHFTSSSLSSMHDVLVPLQVDAHFGQNALQA